ncbi:MAG: hypothetical protein B0D91_13400 [Oceanospirillales bacterium LUC14_002_19_P2]|nr:MAG: hypothetical protein B0D91_13400 [Oceanospirillales bacterium LUC14_002_19_P2]
MWDKDSLGFRVRYLQDKVGGSKQMAELSGVSQSTQSRLIRNKFGNPGLELLKAIADAGGCSVSWLIEGDVEDGDDVAKPKGFVIVPFKFGENRASVMFDRKYLVNVLGVNPDSCLMYQARSDVMAPTFNTDDQLLIDQKSTDGNGLFLIRIDGQLYVQRLQYLPGVGVQVISDNPNYQNYQVAPDQLEIIGRVVWIGGKSRQ